MESPFFELENQLGYRFLEPKFLEQALTHKSYAHEHHCAHNERLEFLGDAILQCMISQLLFDAYPDLAEGMLSKFRAALVSEEALAEVAQEINLGAALRLGHGEELGGGRNKRSILSDALEALLAASFLDSRETQGLATSRALVRKLFEPRMETAESRFKQIDHKTDLQEWVQKNKLGEILYTVIEERGPDHDKEFLMALQVGGVEYGRAWGTSKKRAEQKAAIAALERMGAQRNE